MCGSGQRITSRTRRQYAEDNATIRRHGRHPVWWNNGMETSSSQQHCVAVSCVDTGVVPDGGVMSTTMPPGETGCSGVALGFSSDYLQGRPRGYSGNGHIQRSFQYAVGDHKYAVEIHRSYR